MGINSPEINFWKGKKVFITGHTGFKGAWLCLLLQKLEAEIFGYSLEPPTNPSLYDLCGIKDITRSTIGDIRNREFLEKKLVEAAPEIVIHMAAQPLVMQSYIDPIETYEINVMGTVNLFNAIRNIPSIRAIVNVTTDKCYDNKEWIWGYRENDALGGYDPYSNSKGCSEMVTSAFRNSFFNPLKYSSHKVGLASARAGNVIGGGDWANDRLIPDFVRAILSGKTIKIRSPHAIRPWQHVLEPLTGYLVLAQKLFENGPKFSEGWNFGPSDDDAKPVQWIVEKLCSKWGEGASFQIDSAEYNHEANYLKLDCTKANNYLNWYPRWNLEKALDSIVYFTKKYLEKDNLREVCFLQIDEYLSNN